MNGFSLTVIISNEITHRERYKYLQIDYSWKWNEAVSKLNLFDEFLNEILWFVSEINCTMFVSF